MTDTTTRVNDLDSTVYEALRAANAQKTLACESAVESIATQVRATYPAVKELAFKAEWTGGHANKLHVDEVTWLPDTTTTCDGAVTSHVYRILHSDTFYNDLVHDHLATIETINIEDILGPVADEPSTRKVRVTITRTQTTEMDLPTEQPLTADALDDADWEHIWDREKNDTETTNVTIEAI